MVGGGAALATAAVVGLTRNRDGTDVGIDRQEIDANRLEAGFKREYDGHVWLRTREGQWVEIRLDAKVPGTVLFRDKQDYVWFITFNNIQQIDLTDDYVVIALFGDGSWEDEKQPIQVTDDDGRLVHAQLDQDSFREMISVLS